MPRTLGNSYGTREGGATVVHTYPFQYTTSGIASGTMVIDVIAASTDRPVNLEASVQILEGFDDGVENLISVGTTGGGSDILNISDSSTEGYFPASNAVTKTRHTSETKVFLSINNGSFTTGSAILFLKETTENVVPVV